VHRLVALEKLPCELQEFNQSVFCPVDVGKRAANARRRWKCMVFAFEVVGEKVKTAV
jgi:hypothetical protein